MTEERCDECGEFFSDCQCFNDDGINYCPDCELPEDDCICDKDKDEEETQ